MCVCVCVFLCVFMCVSVRAFVYVHVLSVLFNSFSIKQSQEIAFRDESE